MNKTLDELLQTAFIQSAGIALMMEKGYLGESLAKELRDKTIDQCKKEVIDHNQKRLEEVLRGAKPREPHTNCYEPHGCAKCLIDEYESNILLSLEADKNTEKHT